MGEGVIIVGSGPAGVSAAWPLLQAGVAVTMLDADPGGALPAAPEGTMAGLRGNASRWQVQFGADLAGVAGRGALSPKLGMPLARAVLAGFEAGNRIGVDGFVSLGSLAAGGLSHIWGGAAAVYDAADLAGFPFGEAVLAPSYAAVMGRIGVSQVSGFSPPVGRVWAAAGRRPATDGFELEPARNAVLRADRDGRGGCVQCNLCLFGCHRGSIYHSDQELPALLAMPGFSYRRGARVVRVGVDAGRPVVALSGGEVVRGQRVLLACGTLATTGLVMRALGLARLRLLSNPVAAMAFVVPGLVGAGLPERGFSLGQLAFRLGIGGGVRAAGMLFAADGLPLSTFAGQMPVSRPVALRLARALAPALVLANCYLPGGFSDNAVVLEADGVRLVGRTTAAARAGLREAAQRLRRALAGLGAFAIPGSLTLAAPGADAHAAGTLPMGGDGPGGTDLTGAVSGLPGVHVVDGAALPALPARHYTLTIMANADRIARLLAVA